MPSVAERVDAYWQLLENILTVNAALVGQRQNEETKRLTEASLAQKRGSQEGIGVGRHPVRSDRDRHRVRHELPAHAGTELGASYSFALGLMLVVSMVLYAVFKPPLAMTRPRSRSSCDRPRAETGIPAGVFTERIDAREGSGE